MRDQKTGLVRIIHCKTCLHKGRHSFDGDGLLSLIGQDVGAPDYRKAIKELIVHTAVKSRQRIMGFNGQQGPLFIFCFRMTGISHAGSRHRTAHPDAEMFQAALAGCLDFMDPVIPFMGISRYAAGIVRPHMDQQGHMPLLQFKHEYQSVFFNPIYHMTSP